MIFVLHSRVQKKSRKINEINWRNKIKKVSVSFFWNFKIFRNQEIFNQTFKQKNQRNRQKIWNREILGKFWNHEFCEIDEIRRNFEIKKNREISGKFWNHEILRNRRNLTEITWMLTKHVELVIDATCLFFWKKTVFLCLILEEKTVKK